MSVPIYDFIGLVGDGGDEWVTVGNIGARYKECIRFLVSCSLSSSNGANYRPVVELDTK